MASDEVGRVAFCGLGIMGGPMAANLARAGFELSVYTRTCEKAEQFAAEHENATAAQRNRLVAPAPLLTHGASLCERRGSGSHERGGGT